jgi:hypothetical protein
MSSWLTSPDFPRKLRLMYWLSVIVATILAAYVVAMVVLLPSLSAPPAIVSRLQAGGCDDDTLAPFCSADMRNTPIGIIVPSAEELGLLGCLFILPLGPLFLLTRNRADGDEVSRHIDKMEESHRQWRRRRLIRLPIPRAVLIILGAVVGLVCAMLGPSVEACHATSFNGQLLALFFRLCPTDPPIRALVVPLMFLFFYMTWINATYCWRPFRHWGGRTEDEAHPDEDGAWKSDWAADMTPPASPPDTPPPLRLNPPAKPSTPSFGRRTTPVVDKQKRR